MYNFTLNRGGLQWIGAQVALRGRLFGEFNRSDGFGRYSAVLRDGTVHGSGVSAKSLAMYVWGYPVIKYHTSRQAREITPRHGFNLTSHCQVVIL